MDICTKYLNLADGATGVNLTTLPDGAYVAVNYTNTDAFGKGHVEGIDLELGLIYGGSLIQSGAVDPVATLVVPDYIGQIFVNPTTNEIWISDGIGAGAWLGVASSLGSLSDVTLTAPADGDLLAYDGAAWVNTKEIGAGHDRSSIATASALGGANGRIYPGDGLAPYAGTRGTTVGGDGAEVYGDDAVALSEGKSFGNHSTALAQATTGGNQALASGQSGTVAGADRSTALGVGATAGGNDSLAVGALGTLTGLGVKAATIANSGADLDITLAGEDLTSIFSGGETIKLFGFSGGTYDPTVDATVLDLIVDSSAFGAGDTVLTVLGVNHNAAAASFVYGSRGVNAVAIGNAAEAHQDYSRSMGLNTIAWGPHCEAVGNGAEAGETGMSPQPSYARSIGLTTKALHNYASAMGKESQTRNVGERAFAIGQYSGISWAQERVFLLNQSILAAGGTAPMYTDDLDGGTDEIATFSNHVYAINATVIGSVDASGTVKTAAWRLEAVFRNDSGTLTQVGSTTVTLLGNSDAVVFDTTPVFAVSGTDIRITIADDGSGLDTLRWFSRAVVAELGAA